MAAERLQKIIAQAGIMSRRKAEELIIQGRVKINGKVVKKLGTRADPKKDHIRVDKKLLNLKSLPRYYFIAYKPRYMITSLADPQGRPTVADLLRLNKIKVRVFPVGRLDWDAEGLILLTNDGELANKVMHPTTHLAKTYLVKVKGYPDKQALQRVREGMVIGRGIKTLPVKLKKENNYHSSTCFKITMVEGRQNQIKKMFERIGYPVRSIRRIAIGPLHLVSLHRKEIRHLTTNELKRLKAWLYKSKK